MNQLERWAKGCLGKNRYGSLAHAQEAARQLSRRFGVRYRIYWCRECAGYHLTTKVRQERLNQVGLPSVGGGR
jgi:hypothetical protein